MSGPADVRRTGLRFGVFAVVALTLLVVLVNTMRNGLPELTIYTRDRPVAAVTTNGPYVLPGIFAATARVVRFSSRTPMRASRSRMVWLRVEAETPRSTAALRKLRRRATTAKLSRA